MTHRLVSDKIHLCHIRITGSIQILLINEDIDLLCKDLISFFALIHLFLDTAFHRHREIGKHGSIDIL